MIQLQITKLEKIQQGELSRSRSTSRRQADFRFGNHRQNDPVDIKECYSQGSVDTSRRMLAKQRLYGEKHMLMSLNEIRLKPVNPEAAMYNTITNYGMDKAEKKESITLNLKDMKQDPKNSVHEIRSASSRHEKCKGHHLTSPITNLSLANKRGLAKKQSSNHRYGQSKKRENTSPGEGEQSSHLGKSAVPNFN